jgi:hypothetical protein
MDDIDSLPEKENTTAFPLYKPSDTRMADGGELVLGKH